VSFLLYFLCVVFTMNTAEAHRDVTTRKPDDKVGFRTPPPKNYAIFVIRLTIGAVFLVASISKLSDFDSFVLLVEKFVYVSHPAVQAVAVLLVGIEFLAGLFFVIGFVTRYTAIVIVGLLLIFIAVMIPHLTVGEELPCGCFGALSQENIGASLIVRNLFLMGLTLLFLSKKEQPLSMDALMMMMMKENAQWKH
jgi:putative oxidoreductase